MDNQTEGQSYKKDFRTLTCSYDHDITRIKGTVGNMAYPAFDLCLSLEMTIWNWIVAHPKKKTPVCLLMWGSQTSDVVLDRGTRTLPLENPQRSLRVTLIFQGDCPVLENIRIKTLRSCFQHILAHRWWPFDRSSCGSLSYGGWVKRSRFPKNSLENILLWGVPCVGRPVLSFNCLWTWLGKALSEL